MQNRIYSTDSAKAIKAQEFGVINGIHYMAPHNSAAIDGGKQFTLCVSASPTCIDLCLGMHSGQAAMRKEGEDNATTLSRKAKARRFMTDRKAYMAEYALATAQEYSNARKHGMDFVARFNGSTDIAPEGIQVVVDAKLARKLSKLMGREIASGVYRNVMVLFHEIQFVDYTKIHQRFDRVLPVNYHLTFSRSEINESKCLELLARGVNVAVVFDALPETWNGFTVVNGDVHDLRHLDPRGNRGFVIGLLPKGRKAKKDTSGFVVRSYVDTSSAAIAA